MVAWIRNGTACAGVRCGICAEKRHRKEMGREVGLGCLLYMLRELRVSDV
jgi:hypothetical protein